MAATPRPTPVPFPSATDADLVPPLPDEVDYVAHGVLSAVAVAGVPTPLQTLLVAACFEALTGCTVDVANREHVGPEQLAARLARRDEAYRMRIVQTMILSALVVRPLPIEVADRVVDYARALSIDDGMLEVARGFASGQLALAAVDFDRNGYTRGWSDERTAALHTTGLADAWAMSTDDPALAARWSGLAELPAGTLGRGVWEFYTARGFVFPGREGSAPPLLAQHDWVHVLAGYGSTLESELEVFALIARANDDARGFSLLAMVVSLFETGYLERGAGLFEASPGQLSRDGMATRVADAMRRGALSHGLDGVAPDVDLLGVDWFELADVPIAELRERFAIGEVSAAARAAGSVEPFEPGGISEYQFRADEGGGRGLRGRVRLVRSDAALTVRPASNRRYRARRPSCIPVSFGDGKSVPRERRPTLGSARPNQSGAGRSEKPWRIANRAASVRVETPSLV